MMKEIIIGVGSAVAVSAIILAVMKYQKDRKDDFEVEKAYVDEVNMGEIKTWFKDKLVGGKKGLILYPTKANIEKWNLKVSEGGNLLIQAVYDEEKDAIANYREITFSAISPKLKELLDANGGAFVVE